MLQLRALNADIDGLRPRRFELGLSLGDIASRGDAGVVAIRGELGRTLEGLDRRSQQLAFGIERPQLEIIGGDLRVHAQSDTLEIRPHSPAHRRVASRPSDGSSPHVGLVGGVHRKVRTASASQSSRAESDRFAETVLGDRWATVTVG